MDEEVQSWFENPYFKTLPTYDKELTIGQYFDTKAPTDFKDLKPEALAWARNKFIRDHIDANREAPPSRGVVKDLGVAVLRGGVGVPEMTLRAAAGADELLKEHADVDLGIASRSREIAKRIEGWKDDTLPVSAEASQDGWRRTLTQGTESAVQSIGVTAPAMALGAATGGAGLIPAAGHIGRIGGALIGNIMGSPMFGLATYDTSLEKYEKAGVPKAEARMAALLEGASETGTEVVSSALDMALVGFGGLVGKPIRDAAKNTIKRTIASTYGEAAKRAAAVVGAEMSTELLNTGLQAETQVAYGAPHGMESPRFWDAIKSEFGPIGVSSLIFGAIGGGLHKARTGHVKRLITDPDADVEERLGAVQEVYQEIARKDQGLAERWRDGAALAVLQGKAISDEIGDEGGRGKEEGGIGAAAPVGAVGEDTTKIAQAPEEVAPEKPAKKKRSAAEILTGRPAQTPQDAPQEGVQAPIAPPVVEQAAPAAVAPQAPQEPEQAALAPQGEAIAVEDIPKGALEEVGSGKAEGGNEKPRTDAAATLTGKTREANPESRYAGENLDDLLSGAEQQQVGRWQAINQIQKWLDDLPPRNAAGFTAKTRRKELDSLRAVYEGAYGEIEDAGGDPAVIRQRVEKSSRLEAAPTETPTKPADVQQGETQPESRFKHFTTPERAAGIRTQGYNPAANAPLFGTGSFDEGPKVGRFAGDAIYLSRDDKEWGNLKEFKAEGEPRPATEQYSAENGNIFFDYKKQSWMIRPGKWETTPLEAVEFDVAKDAKILTIDSEDSLNAASKKYGSWDSPEFWKAVGKDYDAVAIDKAADVQAKSPDNNFFKSAKADQLVILNRDKVKIVEQKKPKTDAAAVITGRPKQAEPESTTDGQVQDGDLLNTVGKPYKNDNAARFAQRVKKLGQSHDVVPAAGGFVLRPKIAGATEAAAPPPAADTAEGASAPQGLGKEGQRIWKAWVKRMGTKPGDRDQEDAASWFSELYQAGKDVKPLPTKNGGMPLSWDEREAYKAGQIYTKSERARSAATEVLTGKKAAPAPENSENVTDFRRAIEKDGTASANGIVYRIGEGPPGHYTFTRVENGVGFKKGGVGPNRWSRDRAIDKAVEEAYGEFSPTATEETKPVAVEEKPVKTEAVAETTEETKPSQHDWSNTQIEVFGEVATGIKEFGAQIPDDELYEVPDDPSYGREDKPHITVRYGLATDAPGKLQKSFDGFGPIKASLGEVSIFSHEKYDVVKVDVESADLVKANKIVGETHALPGETFTDYKPHITIAYVKPGEGKKYVGDKRFVGQAITIDKIDLVDRQGKSHSIDLGRAAKEENKPASKPLSEIMVEIKAYSESGAAMTVREKADVALADNAKQAETARRVLDCLNI